MKRGESPSMSLLMTVIVVAGLATMLIVSIVNTPDEVKQTSEEFENYFFGSKEVSCDEQYSDEHLIQIITEKASETTNPAVPPNLAVAVATHESKLDHCREGVVLGSDVDINERDVGVMQINEKTAEICSDLDIYDLEENIECGLKILQNKYNTVNNPRDRGYYVRLVEDHCMENDFVIYPKNYEIYMSYKDDPWGKALRAYNGFGCSDDLGENTYVSDVMSECNNCGAIV